MNIATIIGVIGAFIALVAYILNQSGKLSNDDLRYDVMNTIGSALLVIYALMLGSIPFLILNLVWGGVALKDVLVKILSKK